VSSSTTDATVEIVMPQMGVSMAEGTVTEWRKRTGDQVAADETVCEVTTDKIDVEIPSPASGRMGRILAEEGETVAVGTALAELLVGEAADEASSEQQAAISNGGRDGGEDSGREIDRSGFHSPVVQRIAAEHGIELATVEGGGVGGRVRKADLLALIEGGETRGHDRPLHSESPYREESADAEEPTEAAGPPRGGADELLGPTRREPLSPMRGAIARHMLESRRTSAHCTTIVEADYSAVLRRRAELTDRQVRPTPLAFVARAAIGALERFPILNASIDGSEVVFHEDVNLGIAVALDDGLVVPVIRHAQRLRLEGLAAEIADLAERARAGTLTPDDTHGGTFTITNPGRYGAVLATPIINQPQVAILDVEAIVKRPVAIVDPAGADAIAIRPMGYLCMSWDHRALDGVVAARYLAAVRERLEAGEG